MKIRNVLIAATLLLTASAAHAQRVLVIGYDGFGCADAKALLDAGRMTALARAPQLYCNLSLGMSVTQTGWAATWTGLPPMEVDGMLIGALGNSVYRHVPRNVHLLERIMADNPDVYVAWVSAKAFNVRGNTPESPHYGVYRELVLNGHLGTYQGDQLLTNQQVHDLTQTAITAAGSGPMVAFALFQNPDATGHQTKSLDAYLDAAVEVDGFAEMLIQSAKAAGETRVVLLSDHAFGLKERGDAENGHVTQDKGMLAFDFPTSGIGHSTFTANGAALTLPVVNQGTFPRFLARLFGYDPDSLDLPDTPAFQYSMHGLDVQW